MDDVIELEEIAPTPRLRKLFRSEVIPVQELSDPPGVIVRLDTGSEFLCSRQSFDAVGWTIDGGAGRRLPTRGPKSKARR
jgi:hypothetical protein